MYVALTVVVEGTFHHSDLHVHPSNYSWFAFVGICRFHVSPDSTGLWTVHQEYFEGIQQMNANSSLFVLLFCSFQPPYLKIRSFF